MRILTQRAGWGLFALGTAVFCAVQFYLVFAPIARRAEPVEVDDAYSYIHKAEQMRSDFLQRAPALEDLRRQIYAPPFNARQFYECNRLERRLLHLYHPLHSLLLLALHGTGLTWVRAFELLQLFGVLFIVLGAAAWLLTLWGPGPVGCALLAMALMRFKDQGFHIIVPSNLCLGAAFWVWAAIACGGRIADWAAPLGALLMPWIHPAGKIYAVLTMAAYALERRLPDRRRRVIFAIMLALIMAAAIVPYLITTPAFRALTADALPGDSRMRTLSAAARALGFSALYAFGGYNWLLLLASLLLAVIGVAAVPRAARRQLIQTGIGAILLALAGIAFALPLYPNALAERFIVPLALLVYGAIGHAYWAIGSACVGAMRSRKKQSNEDEDQGLLPSSRAVAYLCLVILVILAAYHAQATWRYWAKERIQIMDRLVHSQPYRLAPDQAAALLRQSREGDRVLYLDEAPLYFYLTYGAAGRGAIYYPTIQGTPSEPTWLHGKDAPRFAVFIHPRHRIPDSTEGGFLWAPKACVEIVCKAPKPLSQWMIRLQSQRCPLEIRMRAHEAASDSITTWTLRFDKPMNEPTWVSLAPPVHNVHLVHGIHLELQTPDPSIQISGVRTSPDSPWDWPWHEGVSVRWTMDHRVFFKALFDPEDLYPDTRLKFRVLDDRGACVLAEIQP
ncbi:MAG: hypothetical protein NTX50_29990 [Candidatus Sumerlaeota bacterium]|nr:hypothetical protein [Candidatus Sumerlaeota bacterium]